MYKDEKIKKRNSLLDRDISIGRIDLAQKAILARHLSVMLKSGLTIVESIEITADQASGKMKKVLGGVLSALNAGQSLSSALGRYEKIFSGMFINVVKAGEVSGTLRENLENIADNLEKERELRSKIKGAMLYPTVILVATFALGLVMAFFVLPKIVPLFEGLKVDLPFSTRALIWFSYIVRDYTWQLALGIFGGVGFLVWLFRRSFFKPVSHWLLLKLPIVGKLTYQSNLARFCRTLGTLLRSGLNIDQALEISASTVGNYYYRRSLAEISGNISKGTKLSFMLEKYPKLYPKLVTRMVRVGEKSGELEGSALFLAHFYEVEIDNTTKAISTAIEPILLIFIGIVVAFLALSIITPIYKITGNIRR